MASFKNKKNLLSGRDEYARYFDNLRGVDFSSDHNDVDDSRFAYLVNMYRDYKSGQGGAIETIPGFRVDTDFVLPEGWEITGVHIGDKKVFIHAGDGYYSWLIYYADIIDGKLVINTDGSSVPCDLRGKKSTSFFYGGYLYVMDGSQIIRIFKNEDDLFTSARIDDVAYIPTTHRGTDLQALTDSIAEDYGGGYDYEQRNFLSPWHKMTFIPDGKTKEYELPSLIEASYEFSASDCSTSNEIKFFDNITITQFGVSLPKAASGSDGKPVVPTGYPNAIEKIYSGEDGRPAKVVFVNPPLRPDKNTWNPNTNSFDEETDGYEWPFAYTSKYEGVEITAVSKITGLSGVTVANQADIINKCTLACVHDNHLFLSGNPDFPTHIFWNGIRSDANGMPDATYFGQLNYVLGGISDAPIVALMSVGDSLMALKSDGNEEESILLFSGQSTGEDLAPKIYTSQRGYRGLGCLGPCFNFKDDPVFITRFGLDALGHVSTKYRRAIKHRSSMVDAKLLNCDLSKASITEWGGYLLILCEGKIFMADSRQMYNTPEGNTEYEWYYLEDIGIYNNQFDEYVYAEFPIDMQGKDLVELTGLPLQEATNVLDENGIVRNLIGTRSYDTAETFSGVTTEGETFYYKELPQYDDNLLKIGTLWLYVEPSGGKTGGTFDPAVKIYAVGDDLIFVTSNNRICQFNFDKRDPETGLIPNEYYDFNGRAIFSGCATKMDNCGIPHLTKTTVKRSTVIKTRSFEASGIKVKVRTNRRAFNQIARIVNSTAIWDDVSFKSYTFSTDDKNIFSVNEREKKWVEKQIFLYSDEFRRPFAIHYLAYRYNIAGRYKE